MTQQEVVTKYRNEIIEGLCIDLIPVSKELLHDVVRLRNQDKSRYFLNQSMMLTLEMQTEWFHNYLNRMDDIYWCVREKKGAIIGTVRLYNITSKSCEHGSLIIDENYSMGLPYALETVVRSLEFAFRNLGVEEIINDDRCDNAMMNSMTKKMGFKFQKVIDIGGVPYNHYVLSTEDSKIEKYKANLESFMNR